MTRSTIIATILLIFGTNVFAAYTKFHYATEESDWKCPGMSWTCIAPSICAYDNLIDRYDCCDTGAEDAVCWNGNTPCEGEEEKTPGSNQIGCSSGSNAFCCLAQREECTQRFNQINVCWERATDPFRGVTQGKMNATFSSLSKASPSASALTVADVAVLTGTPTPSSSPSSSPSSAQSSAASTSSTSARTPAHTSHSATPSVSQAPQNSTTTDAQSKEGVSSGAIGGAVVGAIAGLGLIGGGFFYLFRRRRASNSSPAESELDDNPYVANQAHIEPYPQEKYAHEAAVQAPTTYPAQELSADNVPVEMDASSAPPPKVPHSFA